MDESQIGFGVVLFVIGKNVDVWENLDLILYSLTY